MVVFFLVVCGHIQGACCCHAPVCVSVPFVERRGECEGLCQLICKLQAGRGVVLMVPVMVRHAFFSYESTFFGWQDIDQTGEQCSAVE